MTWWPRRRLWHHIAVVATVVLAAVVGTALEWRQTAPGFPLDDSWIHLQFARNVAEGHGFSFNPGVPELGLERSAVVAPAGSAAAGGSRAVGLRQVAWRGLVAVTAIAGAALTRRLCGDDRAALLAGLAVAVTPRMVWAGLSGMEVPLYTALVTVAMLAYVRALDNPRAGKVLWALWAGLAGWARPEAFVAAAILGAAWLAEGARDGRRDGFCQVGGIRWHCSSF